MIIRIMEILGSVYKKKNWFSLDPLNTDLEIIDFEIEYDGSFIPYPLSSLLKKTIRSRKLNIIN